MLKVEQVEGPQIMARAEEIHTLLAASFDHDLITAMALLDIALVTCASVGMFKTAIKLRADSVFAHCGDPAQNADDAIGMVERPLDESEADSARITLALLEDMKRFDEEGE